MTEARQFIEAIASNMREVKKPLASILNELEDDEALAYLGATDEDQELVEEASPGSARWLMPSSASEGEQRMTTAKFSVGDRVTYTNEFGVVFCGKVVTEVVHIPDDPEAHGTWAGQTRYYISPTDAPWFPVRERELTLEVSAHDRTDIER